MDAFLISTGIVALAEIGDKTQLLTLVLAARYRKPWPIVAGIFVATLINHGIAGAAGAWLTSAIGPSAMRWVLGLSFLAMAVWMLIPDKLDGDKTQIATVALAARFDSLAAVVLGTTLGMMLANAPVAFFGDAIARRLPVSIVHRVAAAVFALLGIGVLVTG